MISKVFFIKLAYICFRYCQVGTRGYNRGDKNKRKYNCSNFQINLKPWYKLNALRKSLFYLIKWD